MRIAAIFALLLAAPAAAQAVAPEAPAVATMQLYPVYISKTETAFTDKASLVRTGDLVEGWNLNVYAKPTQVATGYTTDVHWTRFRMSCATNRATMTWLLGRDLIRTTFKARIDKEFWIPPKTGWDHIYFYMCRNAALFKGKAYTESVAIALAKREMPRAP